METRLYVYLRSQQRLCFSTGSVKKGIEASWALQNDIPKDRCKFMALSTWRKFLLAAEQHTIRCVQQSMLGLCAQNSRRLSLDHTFRSVKCLAARGRQMRKSVQTPEVQCTIATDGNVGEEMFTVKADGCVVSEHENLLVPLAATPKHSRTVKLATSALYVLNEHDCVVGADICPNQGWAHVRPVLSKILEHQQVLHTEVVWTDNVSSDKRNIQTSGSFGCSVKVGQDLFHVCDQRILRYADRQHPNFSEFRRNLKAVFARLRDTSDAYETRDEFVGSLKNLIQKFRQPRTSQPRDDLSLLQAVVQGIGDAEASSSGTAIMTPALEKQILLQTRESVVEGLWQHYNFQHHGMVGTTNNEQFHSFLNRKMPAASVIGLGMYEVYVHWAILDWNKLKLQKVPSAEVKGNGLEPIKQLLDQADKPRPELVVHLEEPEAACFDYHSKASFKPLKRTGWTDDLEQRLRSAAEETFRTVGGSAGIPPKQSISRFIKRNFFAEESGISEKNIKLKLNSWTILAK